MGSSYNPGGGGGGVGSSGVVSLSVMTDANYTNSAVGTLVNGNVSARYQRLPTGIDRYQGGRFTVPDEYNGDPVTVRAKWRPSIAGPAQDAVLEFNFADLVTGVGFVEDTDSPNQQIHNIVDAALEMQETEIDAGTGLDAGSDYIYNLYRRGGLPGDNYVGEVQLFGVFIDFPIG